MVDWGRSGETCGAVSGAMMALGLKYGQSSVDTPEKKQKTYELAQEFLKQFHARYGATRCNDLTGTDITDPEAASIAKESGLYARICPGFIRDAVEIADKILTLSDGSH